MTQDKPIKRVRAEWREIVLVCRKCSKKLDGGFGRKGEASLAKSLRKILGGKSRKREAPIGVIETGCFDICPKGAVVALRASTPSDWTVVPRGTPIEAVIERLGLQVQEPAPVADQP